jgi:patatin-like phospholipase
MIASRRPARGNASRQRSGRSSLAGPRIARIGNRVRVSVAFVLGGGGQLGAAEVGTLHALLKHEVRPDLILGTSVGALHEAVVARDPSVVAVTKRESIWRDLTAAGGPGELVVHGGHPFANPDAHAPERPASSALARRLIGVPTFEELAVPFECVAACTREARSTGSAVAARRRDPRFLCCAILPPVRIDGEHVIDGEQCCAPGTALPPRRGTARADDGCAARSSTSVRDGDRVQHPSRRGSAFRSYASSSASRCSFSEHRGGEPAHRRPRVSAHCTHAHAVVPARRRLTAASGETPRASSRREEPGVVSGWVDARLSECLPPSRISISCSS